MIALALDDGDEHGGGREGEGEGRTLLRDDPISSADPIAWPASRPAGLPSSVALPESLFFPILTMQADPTWRRRRSS